MSSVPPPRSSSYTAQSGSRGRSDVPVGIYVIVAIGLLGSVFGVLGALELAANGYGIFAAVIFVLAAVEAVAVLGLLGLKAWALMLCLVLYGLGGFVDLFRGNLIGLILSAVVIAYLLSIADRFD